MSQAYPAHSHIEQIPGTWDGDISLRSLARASSSVPGDYGELKYFAELSVFKSAGVSHGALTTTVSGTGNIVAPYSQSCKFFIKY